MIAIYARQSVEKKDSISIESQIEYAKREVFSEDFKIYQDSGYSGKNTNRPAFHEMMADVQSGRIEKVVVYRLDRISRSILDFADFINILESNHISFVSATEKFDTSTPMGRAMLYIIVVFAHPSSSNSRSAIVLSFATLKVLALNLFDAESSFPETILSHFVFIMS